MSDLFTRGERWWWYVCVCVCAREREKTKREVRRQRGSLFVFLRVESIEADFLFQASSE